MLTVGDRDRMPFNIRDLIYKDLKTRNPGAAREISEALKNAAESPGAVDPRVTSEDEILGICEKVLAEWAVDPKDYDGKTAEDMVNAGYPTYAVDFLWPRGDLANKVTEDGWTRSFRNAVRAKLDDHNLKRPGQWMVVQVDRALVPQTRMRVVNVPNKDGIVTESQEVPQAYVTIGLDVLFVDVLNSPAPVYDAQGRLSAEQVTTLKMPPEFGEAMALLAESVKTAQAPAKRERERGAQA